MVGWQRKKVCHGCMSEALTCKVLNLGRDISWECMCAISGCDRDLTFNLSIVTLSLKILFGLYLRNCKV